MIYRRLISLTAISTMPLLFAACTGGNEPESLLPEVTAKGAALIQAQDCGDLLQQIQADAITKLNESVEQYQRYGYGSGYGYPTRGGSTGDFDDIAVDEEADFGGDGDGDATAGGDSNQGVATPGPAAPSADPSDGSGESAGENPSGHSETNTQVQDVDEADIVKISEDGKRLFLVHGSEFKVIGSWPAEDLSEAGAATVEGTPYELFAYEDRVVIFSHFYPQGVTEKGDNEKSCPDCCYWENFTKVSVFDVTENTPSLVREMAFEGDYVSSRRVDEIVRMVVRGGFSAHDLYYPSVDFYDSFGNRKSDERIEEDLEHWRAGVEQDILATSLEDWIPRSYEKKSGEWKEMASACQDYYIPQPGLVRGGVTRVVSFEMDGTDTPEMTSVLGGSDVVYSNKEAMVVTQTDWRWDTFGDGESVQTSVHRFDLDGLETGYDASGFAPGYLENQFSLHEKDGVVFLSTTEEDWGNGDWRTLNTIITLSDESDDSELSILDRTENMGEPGERIYATRFLGNRAYVVTFRETDPLYAVDVSDPADLKILGELHIPGFSEYIHPLGEDHLLTIGMNTGGAAVGVDWGDGADPVDLPATEPAPEGDAEPAPLPGEEVPDEVEPPTTDEGVALQIFDVSDPSNPQLVHKELFGGFSYSEANYNHKAFTFVDDYFDADQSLLMFPLVTYEPDYRAGLEVLSVSVADGFERLGSIDHRPLINHECGWDQDFYEPCYYWGGEEMRRGMQIDEYVYALSQGGVTVHSLDDLSGDPIATVLFDYPRYQGNSCYGDWYYGDEEWVEDVDWDEGDVSEPMPEPPPEIGAGGASGDGDASTGSEDGDGAGAADGL